MRCRQRRVISFVLMLLLLLAPLVGQAVTSSKPATDVAEWNKDDPQSLTPACLYGQSAILIDARSGDVLFAKNANAQLNPASVTKVLTALIVLENTSLDEVVTFNRDTSGPLEATWLPMEQGEQFKVKDLLYGMILRSFNDFSAALAVHVGGSLENFAAMMNRKAQEIGCTDSNFAVPHGLTTANHYTSAADVAKIMRVAMEQPVFREILAAPSYILPASNKRPEPTDLANSNKMLPGIDASFAYDGCLGGKTGFTAAAQHTFVAAAQRDGVSLICVVLGTGSSNSGVKGDGKWLDATKLFDYGFASYTRLDIATLYAQRPLERTIDGASTNDTGMLKLDIADPASLNGIIVPKDQLTAIQGGFSEAVQVEFVHDLKAPIEKGEVVAVMTVPYGDGNSAAIELAASRSITQLTSSTAALPATAVAQGQMATGAPLTLTQIADGATSSSTRYLGLLLLIPLVLLLVLFLSIIIDISKRRKRLRTRKVGEQIRTRHYGQYLRR